MKGEKSVFAPGTGDGVCRIALPEAFDFTFASLLLIESHAVQGRLQNAEARPGRLVFDFERTTHIDTAGMGCILLMAERFGPYAPVSLENAKGQVADLLDLAQIVGRIDGSVRSSAALPQYQACVDCGVPSRGLCRATPAEANNCDRVRPLHLHAAPQTAVSSKGRCPEPV